MARSINTELTSLQTIESAPISLMNMSVLGFNITNNPSKKEELFANLFFMFVNSTTKEPYIIKHSFLLNDVDDDMAFFQHPLHNPWNMERMDKNTKEVITKLFENFSHNNSFYTDMKPIRMTNDTVTLVAANINVADHAIVKEIEIPFSDFYRIQVIINDIIFKRRLHINIDSDISYNNYSIRDIAYINYLGADIVHDPDTYMAFFALHSVNITGVAIPVIVDKDNIMVNINKVTIATFNSLYKDNFMCDMSKIIMWPVVTEEGISYRIAINRLLPAGKRSLMITKDSVEDSPLLNPIKYIFSK